MIKPNYKTYDPRGWMGDPRRGAAIGRPTLRGGDPEGKMSLRRVYLSSGGYDSNGTYFGFGDPIYWYADQGGNVDGTLRATSRDGAKAQILADYPTARFYR